MLGLSFEKLILVGIIAAIVIGPQRLPHYAQKLGELVRLLRAQIDTARTHGYVNQKWPQYDGFIWPHPRLALAM